MSVPFALMIASSDETFREMVRDNLLNVPESKVGSEYQEVSSNLYVRVMQDLERHPNAAVILDMAGDTEQGLKSLERLKQAVPDLYVIASHYHADGETVIQALRAGANDFILQPIKRTDFREAMARFERAPRRVLYRQQAGQSLHFRRDPWRRGHYHSGGEFRGGTGAT